MSTQTDRRQFMRTSLATGATLGVASGVSPLNGFPTGGPAPVEEHANRRVPPGRVAWCRDFTAACAVARNSGKPVMHFFMMGRLDQEFC